MLTWLKKKMVTEEERTRRMTYEEARDALATQALEPT